jgi:spore germination protein
MAAWQMLILDDLYVLLGTYLVLKIASKFPSENCSTYLPRLLGKYLGAAVVGLLIAYNLFEVILLCRGVADVARLGLLPTTPQWIIASLFLFPAAYAVSYGMTPIARIVDGILPSGFLIITLSFLTLVPNINMDFFTGFWLWTPAIFFSMNFLATLNYVSCFIILYILYPYIQATPRQILRSAALALGLASTFMYAPVTYLPILTFGPEGVADYRSPLFSAIEIAPVTFYLIEDVSVIFYSVWSFVSFAGASLYFFCAMELLYPLLPVKNGLWLIPMGLILPLAYLATYESLNQFLPWIRYSGMLTLFLAIILPIFLLFLHAVRRRKEHVHEAG